MDVLVEDEEHVRHIVLNRPAKRNALTMQMCKDIVAAVKAAGDFGCILLRANGTAFSAGMDLRETVPGDELLAVHEQLFTLGAQAVKPIVVAVNGAALAGGLGLAAQGHIVLASTNATFGLPELKIGFWPFVVYRAMEAALGKRRTLELSLTGDTFTAEQAKAWGLVRSVHSEAELGDVAKNLAVDIAGANARAIELGLRYVREAEGKTPEEAGRIAATLRAELAATGEHKRAFEEKRHGGDSGAADRS